MVFVKTYETVSKMCQSYAGKTIDSFSLDTVYQHTVDVYCV